MKRVVMFSGGLGSWMTAKRVADKYGTDDLVLLFADVGGQHISPHAGEDADTYRFINEAAAQVGGELVVLNEGRDIWEVFRDDRFLGNSRLANCSKYLKQIPCREWLDANCDPADTTIYVGIDWSESHRLPAIEKAYLPYRAEAPMTEKPYLDKSAMQLECLKSGMAIPRLYTAGFPHNNCGGGCVRAGQAQFELLLRENPDRYAYWETQEQGLRDHLSKDVTILRDRTGGDVTPLTLTKFREDLEQQPALFDALDFGGILARTCRRHRCTGAAMSGTVLPQPDLTSRAWREAVEVAAQGLYASRAGRSFSTWGIAPRAVKQPLRRQAEQALLAAYPLLRDGIAAEVLAPEVVHAVAKASWDRGERDYWDYESDMRPFDPSVEQLDGDDCDRGRDWVGVVTEVLTDLAAALSTAKEASK